MTKSRDLANAATALNAVTAAELQYVDGVTSAIQTQIDTKLATATAATTYVANSLADAKGDIFVATADNTVTRLPVGNSGEQIVADSSTSTGLRYQTPVQQNPVLNSAMQVWQRGTSFVPTTTTYSADRWQAYRGTTGSTVTRQVTGDTTNLPNIQYCARVSRDSGTTSTQDIYLSQAFESVNAIPFAGKTVTLSFYARKGANFSGSNNSQLNVNLYTGTGTDQNVLTGYTGSVTAIGQGQILTTTWVRYSFTATLATTATELQILFGFTPNGTAGVADYYEITGVQLEVGSVATPFKTYAATIQGELAACQRYYWRATGGDFVPHGLGFAVNTTTSVFNIQNPVSMRIAPTSVDYANVGVGLPGTGVYSITSLSIDRVTTNIASVSTSGSSGLTANRPYILQGVSGTTNFVGFSAEL